MIKAFDTNRDLAVLKTEKEAIDFALDHFIKCANNAIKNHGFFTVALSGGSTPKAIFKVLSEKENASKVDFKKVYLFWSDERAVPLDDADSNYKMAMDAGLKALVPKENIFPMNGTGDLEKNAQEYETLIKKHCYDQRLDLCMLGMGDDGHTASLFPHTKALHINDRTVVKNEVPQKNCDRLTLTFKAINSSKSIVLYVLGKGKAEMVKTVFQTPLNIDEYPVQGVGNEKTKALYIFDEAASALLLPKLL